LGSVNGSLPFTSGGLALVDIIHIQLTSISIILRCNGWQVRKSVSVTTVMAILAPGPIDILATNSNPNL
jgi:hypothetical protein